MRVLCRSGELVDSGDGLRFETRRGSRTEPAFAIRFHGTVRAFLNLENLGDVRQTRWQRIVLPAQGDYGRWTADSWAQLEGRIFNGGIRFSF